MIRLNFLRLTSLQGNSQLVFPDQGRSTLKHDICSYQRTSHLGRRAISLALDRMQYFFDRNISGTLPDVSPVAGECQ